MTTRMRGYRHPEDYDAVGRFLVRTHRATASGPHRNWLQPRWEYMHYHPYCTDEILLDNTLWEDDGEIVAVAHFETDRRFAYLQIDPVHATLKRELLEVAEARLFDDFDFGRAVQVFLDDDDAELAEIARSRGFEKRPEISEVTSTLPIPDDPDELGAGVRVPDGYRVISRADDGDLRKLHRVLHRGFNHDGEPPEDDLAGREKMQSAPNYRRDLNIVVQAPDGSFAALCGMWIDRENRVAYVEPVATDPDHRRLGLGTAAVLEGVRRCGAEGATIAHVGSTQPFYRSMGFQPAFAHTAWRKMLDGNCRS